MCLNRLWAALTVDTCVARGADHFFLAPGSRCTPLTLAVAQHPATKITQHFDERGLAYAALGYSRATGKPGVFVCTSGTAVANAFPAVVEASSDHIPLLLLTADRPPELRDTGANQTIDQQRIFGNYVRWHFDMPCPTDDVQAVFVRAQVDYALERSCSGPVHLNCMFREPFGASDEPLDISPYPLAPRPSRHSPGANRYQIPGGPTLVVVGRCRPAEARAAAELADRLQVPLLGDVTSGLRTTAYDLALGDTMPGPTTVVHVGERIVSKNWSRFLEHVQPQHLIHITNTGQRIASPQLPAERIVGTIPPICRQIELLRPSPADYLAAWQNAHHRCHELVSDVLTAESRLNEPTVAFVLANMLPRGHGLFLGNSMPVRDMDRYGFWPTERNITVGANRGASGIDGLIASAVGFAQGLGEPTTLLIGDLSTLHDLNSLAMLKRADPPVIVVIVNNHGGAIFDLLPVAGQTQHYERFFATPHDLSFSSAAKMFSVAYQNVGNVDEFRSAYATAAQSGKSTILELVTDRKLNQQLRRKIQQRLSTRES